MLTFSKIYQNIMKTLCVCAYIYIYIYIYIYTHTHVCVCVCVCVNEQIIFKMVSLNHKSTQIQASRTE